MTATARDTRRPGPRPPRGPTVAGLRKLLSARGVRGVRVMRRAELLAALASAPTEEIPCPQD